MSTIDQRCYGIEPAATELRILRAATEMMSKRIDWTVADNVRRAIAIDDLVQARIKDAKDHEEAMRVLISMLAKRSDIIRNQQSRADNWMKTAITLGRRNKILESRIRHDDRSFLAYSVSNPGFPHVRGGCGGQIWPTTPGGHGGGGGEGGSHYPVAMPQQ